MPSTTLADLQAMIVNFRRQRDWEQFHNPKDMALGLALEAAELMELVHWRQGAELADHLKTNRQALADELADLLGWILLFAEDHQINLATAFKNKMKKNRAKYPIQKARGRHTKYTEL